MPQNKTLILFYSKFWGSPVDLNSQEFPPGFEISTDRDRLPEASALVFHLPDTMPSDLPSKPRGQVWVAWYRECEVHYLRMKDPEFMGVFDLTMSYRRDADIPVPYYYPKLAETLYTPPKSKSDKKLLAMFISARLDRSGRRRYLAALMSHLDVHSYGKLWQNKLIEDDHGIETKLEIISGYKFTIAFENAIARDYVTEKFFEPLIAGSVPIYRGAPNIEDFAPADHCYINAARFKQPEDLAEFLCKLNEDDAAYQEYMSWKQAPLRPGFLKMLDDVREPQLQRLCLAVQQARVGQSSTILDQIKTLWKKM
jgi:hypothetical protein